MALYNFLTKHKYKLPVSSYIELMAEKYAPKVMPPRVVYEEDDGFRIEVPYKLIRLWEIDPGIAFEHGCGALLPWVPLLKGGISELERAGAAIRTATGSSCFRALSRGEDGEQPCNARITPLP